MRVEIESNTETTTKKLRAFQSGNLYSITYDRETLADIETEIKLIEYIEQKAEEYFKKLEELKEEKNK